jgi:hypothetical protein
LSTSGPRRCDCRHHHAQRRPRREIAEPGVKDRDPVQNLPRKHGRRERSPGAKPGHVYFVRCNNADGLIKFGCTKGVAGRISSLQCGNPYQLNLLVSFYSDDAARTEAGLI